MAGTRDDTYETEEQHLAIYALRSIVQNWYSTYRTLIGTGTIIRTGIFYLKNRKVIGSAAGLN